MKPRVLFFCVVFVMAIFGCAALTAPGPEGDRTRQEVHDAIRSVVPAPWGELIGVVVTTVAGGIAAAKHRQAGAAIAAARSTVAGLEDIYQVFKYKAENGGNAEEKAEAAKVLAALKSVKERAKKVSGTLGVSKQFEAVVASVAPKAAGKSV